jgi:hypothetical protein
MQLSVPNYLVSGRESPQSFQHRHTVAHFFSTVFAADDVPTGSRSATGSAAWNYGSSFTANAAETPSIKNDPAGVLAEK